MKKILFFAMMALLLLVAVACGNGDSDAAESNEQDQEDAQVEETPEDDVTEEDEATAEDAGVVNLYTSRHYDTDRELYDLFTEETGIVVNVIEGSGPELIERMNIEGEATEADVFITADAGNLHVAKMDDLFQTIESEVLFNNIPENLRDADNQWFGLTQRARVFVYAKDRVDPSELSTYEAITGPEWEGRLLARTSENMYNISIMASFIELWGAEAAEEWANGFANNMARDPQGGDTDQARAVVAGEGDVALMNTYYIGRLLNSEDPGDVEVGEAVGVFFPNQDTTGTHVNISGAGITKHSKNVENAIKFLEFLSGEHAQQVFAEGNNEYPANPNVPWSDTVAAWGEFKAQDINLTILGENQQEAIRIFDRSGWK
ncbi:iron(III) transport system substrate-binding protein [Evansella vedderi]|uniref:Iron(III) transport system substrate-binding protein n=1 Tax=Evansella vedderi TaxID=38282 RepID=A0ABT9ZPW0_9BACI|nr:Fe(3+) ABC transporter substrate-binding protein [Evansella vedderi]MDQ0252761.1 iron(III) transport system substrate-binding protein [Evansella vedderi]